jgi:hypothetical protein
MDHHGCNHATALLTMGLEGSGNIKHKTELDMFVLNHQRSFLAKDATSIGCP